jgi:hypothetical protein
MDILNVRLARSVWIFEARDLNPIGLNLLPLAASIKEKYKFLVWPNTPEQLLPDNPKGAVFQSGAFAVGNQVLTVNFTLYSDGIVADTGASTDHTDTFIEDLLVFGQQFGLIYRPDMVQRKRCLSELIVRPTRQLGSVCDKLGALASKLNQMVIPSEAFYEWTGFELGVEQRFANQPASFKFEREAKTPFELNRFYSCAPLRTDQHKNLLLELEAIMT